MVNVIAPKEGSLWLADMITDMASNRCQEVNLVNPNDVNHRSLRRRRVCRDL